MAVANKFNSNINTTFSSGNQSAGILDDFKTSKVDLTQELHCKTFTMPTGAGATKILTSDANGIGSWTAAADCIPGCIALTSLNFPQGYATSVGAGFVEIYTVPANKKLLVKSCYSLNTTVGAISGYAAFKTGGNYYRLKTNATISPNLGFSLAPTLSVILEAGETFCVYCAAAGVNLWMNGIEFADTVNVKLIRNLSLGNGNNTVYTVPVGKQASILDNTPFAGYSGATAYVNNTAGAITVYWYYTPNGGAQLQCSGSTSASANASYMFSAMATLKAGDVVGINTNSGNAGQSAYISVVEIDA